MLFNSAAFIFGFLPVVLGGFWWLRAAGHWRQALGFLTLASFVFYGWWNPAYLLLIGFSILSNFGLGIYLQSGRPYARAVLMMGITGNLLLLGVYKYMPFIIPAWRMYLPDDLPLAISFFTFTQIIFLIDCSRGVVQATSPARYGLFVTFFPHLIAGPIVHYRELMHQFATPQLKAQRSYYLAWGLSVFTVGLAQKILLADNLAPYADRAFQLANAGQMLGFFDSWGAALAYSLQLYFDFSGYSDMAVGLALMFGIHLPVNFNAPYRAVNIIDFWRRWHITLSRFFRDYVYAPLGGNRHGWIRQSAAVMVTMLLAGIWHGAGWNFVLWGAYHGVLLLLCHGWQALFKRPSKRIFPGQLLTFGCVVAGWVIFRTSSPQAALHMLEAMMGFQGFSLPSGWRVLLREVLPESAFRDRVPLMQAQILWILAGLGIVWCVPHSAILFRLRDVLLQPVYRLPESRCYWHPSTGWMVMMGMLFALACLGLSRAVPFVYFTF